jgi:hypothetical protein
MALGRVVMPGPRACEEIEGRSFRGAGTRPRARNPRTPLLQIQGEAPVSWVPGLPQKDIPE